MSESPVKKDVFLCRHCGKEVAPDAKQCVHCGSTSPKPKKDTFAEQRVLARIGWWTLGLLTVGWILYQGITVWFR